MLSFNILLVSACLSLAWPRLRLAAAVVTQEGLAGTVVVDLLRSESHLVADAADCLLVILLALDGLSKVLQASGDLKLEFMRFGAGGGDLDLNLSNAGGVARHDCICGNANLS